VTTARIIDGLRKRITELERVLSQTYSQRLGELERDNRNLHGVANDLRAANAEMEADIARHIETALDTNEALFQAEAELAALKAENERLEESSVYWRGITTESGARRLSNALTENRLMLAAINWATGCGDSDFGNDLPADAPPYWWRSVMCEKAGLVFDRELFRWEARP
jgi:hypothetical protein